MSKKQIPDESNPFLALDKSRFAKERSVGGGHKQKQAQAEVKALLKAAAKAKAEQSAEDDNYFATVMNFGGVSRLPESAKIVRKGQLGQAGQAGPTEKNELKELLPEAELDIYAKPGELGGQFFDESAAEFNDDFAGDFAGALAAEDASPMHAYAAPPDMGALKATADLKKQSANVARAHEANQSKVPGAEAFDSPLQGLLAGVKIGSNKLEADSKNFDPNLNVLSGLSDTGRQQSSSVRQTNQTNQIGRVSQRQATQQGGPDLPASSLPPGSLPDDDEFLFVEAMNAVAPLKSSGRAIAPPPLASSAIVTPSNPLQDFMDGKVEFSLAHTDEYVEGHVLGLDPAVIVKMRAGGYSFEAHLDLHGLNAVQAFDALVAFLRSSYQRGLRNVLIIPGRGKNSPDGFGLLRDKVQEWFTQDPFKRVVLAFCTALPRHGGPGALYVLLRKFKKSRGKVFWDKRPSDPDLFI